MWMKQVTEKDKIFLHVTFTPVKTSGIRLVCPDRFPLHLPVPTFGDLEMETHQLEGAAFSYLWGHIEVLCTRFYSRYLLTQSKYLRGKWSLSSVDYLLFLITRIFSSGCSLQAMKSSSIFIVDPFQLEEYTYTDLH